tara:strand:+ start:316 stop:471 length:156 start_codon:yes stop_codon:yes gene_type:complete
MPNEFLIDATTAAETIATIAASPAAGDFGSVAFYLAALFVVSGLALMTSEA